MIQTLTLNEQVSKRQTEGVIVYSRGLPSCQDGWCETSEPTTVGGHNKNLPSFSRQDPPLPGERSGPRPFSTVTLGPVLGVGGTRTQKDRRFTFWSYRLVFEVVTRTASLPSDSTLEDTPETTSDPQGDRTTKDCFPKRPYTPTVKILVLPGPVYPTQPAGGDFQVRRTSLSKRVPCTEVIVVPVQCDFGVGN